jgi:RNA polymerase sigma factor for flagellar operon FliA
MELEDLVQAGLVALTECAQRHQGPGEDGFAAYAKMRVRGAMVDVIRRSVPLSRGAAGRRRMLREKEDHLRGILGREPRPDELAGALGIEEGELASLRASSQPLRFEPIEEAYSDSDMAFADDRLDSLSLLEQEEMRESVITAITALPERLQLIVQLYFVEELNLSEIAQVLSVSIPRVHQLKAQALSLLRERLAGVAELA